MAKYIIVCGGVISGTGKGVTACSIGLLLKLCGHQVQYIKLDGYLNVNAGIIRPGDHGEVFLCDDGSETDLDLGYAERILGINVGKDNIATSGLLFKQLIERQEAGEYLGSTVQLTPHLTELVQDRLLKLGKESDVVVCEIGGTVGDAENYAFFEAIRQLKQKQQDVIVSMVAPILWMPTIQEFKTKPLQNAVKELQRHGIQPDALFCRVDRDVSESILDKVSMLTGVDRNCVITAIDVKSIYQVPLEFYNRHVDDLFVDLLRLSRKSCRIHKYREVVEKYLDTELPSLDIGIVAKYDMIDAYISLKEALIHAGAANDVRINIHWIKAEELEKYRDQRGIYRFFNNIHGVVVAPGFDNRGVEGKIRAIQYVREKKIPFLGICLGLQCAIIEFARNVCGIQDANSIEFDKKSKSPVIHFVAGQESVSKKCGTMRLGAYDCIVKKDTLARQLYKRKLISERHRHRYEVNALYEEKLSEHGFIVSGKHPDTGLIEIMELDSFVHPFFIGTQAHPEFRSRLGRPNPLFSGLIAAALEFNQENNT